MGLVMGIWRDWDWFGRVGGGGGGRGKGREERNSKVYVKVTRGTSGQAAKWVKGGVGKGKGKRREQMVERRTRKGRGGSRLLPGVE